MRWSNKITINTAEKQDTVSRRDFFRVAAYGMNSPVLAATALRSITLPQLAQAAEGKAKSRAKAEKYTITFGASGFNEKNLLVERGGCLGVLRDVEARTDGELKIEFIGDNQLCGQTNCVKNTQQGIVDAVRSVYPELCWWRTLLERT